MFNYRMRRVGYFNINPIVVKAGCISKSGATEKYEDAQ